MALDRNVETSITYADLQDLRTTLITVHTCLSARDLSDSAASTLGEVRYRPLTREVERVLLRVKGLLGDLVMAHLDEVEADESDEPDESEYDYPEDFEPDERDEDTPVYEEDLLNDPLSENPLGSRTIVPQQDHFEWDEEDEEDEQ